MGPVFAVNGALHPVPRDSRVYVAGHRGLAGSAVRRHLVREGFSDVVGRSSSELDLRDRGATFDFVSQVRPDVVVLAAARVGGIMANAGAPADFLSDNLQIQVNVMDAAREVGVPRLLFLGSSCVYPREAAQPMAEDALMTGSLEPTNDGYAVAKIAGLMQVRAVRRQDGLRWISAMPSNLYGPGDNFDPTTSHVVPGLMRRFHEAVVRGEEEVVLWGTGTPRREFLHADDLASAVLHLLDTYDSDEHVNVGAGSDVTILHLAELVAQVTGFSGRITTDPTKPDGAPRKLLDTTRLERGGWAPTTGLVEGLSDTYRWFLASGHAGAGAGADSAPSSRETKNRTEGTR